MIELIFNFLNEEIVSIIVNGNNVYFGNSKYGVKYATIDDLKLDYAGVCREFPDLETEKDWKKTAIKRFKDRIKTLKTEDERAKYIIEDLRKHGYKPMMMQRKGFRPVRLK